LKTLHEIWKARFLDVFQSGQVLNEKQQTIKIDHWGMMVLDQILDLQASAIKFTRIREDGFFNTHIHPNFDPKLELSQAAQKKICANIEATRLKTLDGIIDDCVEVRKRGREEAGGFEMDFMREPGKMFDHEWGYKDCDPAIDNPPERLEEPWVSELSKDRVQEFGFVVYRLCYVDEGDWSEFVLKMEDAVNSGWEGVVGAEGIKGKARFHWIDGREEKISEGDLDAARE
jgi:hypothetical protein